LHGPAAAPKLREGAWTAAVVWAGAAAGLGGATPCYPLLAARRRLALLGKSHSAAMRGAQSPPLSDSGRSSAALQPQQPLQQQRAASPSNTGPSLAAAGARPQGCPTITKGAAGEASHRLSEMPAPANATGAALLGQTLLVPAPCLTGDGSCTAAGPTVSRVGAAHRGPMVHGSASVTEVVTGPMSRSSRLLCEGLVGSPVRGDCDGGTCWTTMTTMMG
jgi:hypothetical protein